MRFSWPFDRDEELNSAFRSVLGAPASVPIGGRTFRWTSVFTALLASTSLAEAATVNIQVQESAFTYTDPGNGAAALWNYPSTTLVREGSRIIASGVTYASWGVGVNKFGCTLGTRDDSGGGWTWIPVNRGGTTREPCPIAVDRARGMLFMTANVPRDQASPLNTEPAILGWSTAALSSAEETYRTPWWHRYSENLFFEHSYRSLAVHPIRPELFSLQQSDWSHAEWVLHNYASNSNVYGRLDWPIDLPRGTQGIRVAYGAAQLVGDAAHYFAVSNVQEPVNSWQNYMVSEGWASPTWVFRRLFYTSTPSLATKPFGRWIEVANLEASGGHMNPGDMRAEMDGSVHVVWNEWHVEPRLYGLLVANLRQSQRLMYAKIKDGSILTRRTLIESFGGPEDLIGPNTPSSVNPGAPTSARLHRLASGQLVLLYSLDSAAHRWGPLRNQMMFLGADGEPGQVIDLPFSPALKTFVLANERAGSAPSNTIDLLGTKDWGDHEVFYVRLGVNS